MNKKKKRRSRVAKRSVKKKKLKIIQIIIAEYFYSTICGASTSTVACHGRSVNFGKYGVVFIF